TLACACLSLCGLSLAGQPPSPKPGPEHALLKKFVGDWEANVSFMGGESKGTAHNRIGLGGFWLLTEFQGEFGGTRVEGRGATGYDPAKKKYVNAWIDSMSPSMMVMEGSFDKDGKTYTETGDGPGPDGKPMKMKSIYQFKDDDTMIFTMYTVMDGKDQEM